jgi:hypothetical protein
MVVDIVEKLFGLLVVVKTTYKTGNELKNCPNERRNDFELETWLDIVLSKKPVG